MPKNNFALRRYCWEIRSLLPVSRRQKDKVITDLRCSIQAYLDAHPEANLPEIQSHFGTPSSIAAAYVDNADTADLLRDLRLRKRIVTIVVAGVLAIVFAAVITLSLELATHFNSVNGSYAETVTQNEETLPAS